MFRRFLNSPWPYFIGAGILVVVAIATQFELHFPSRKPGTIEDVVALRDRDDLNVLFIVVDTLRADRLGIYGYERPTSPTIDDLARYGVLFRNVQSQSSWTKTSMASLWTGTYPANHGITRYNHALPEAALMPAEIFKEAGYRTAGIWRNGWVAPNFGFGQGFDMYVRPRPGRESIRIRRKNPANNKIQGTDEDLLDAASDFLDNFGRDRFLLYLHYMDLHQYIYDGQAAKFGSSYSDVYDQSISWTDRVIAAVIQKLDDLDLLTKTVVVICSDHGEAFLEHGTEGHAKNLHAEVTQVPFIISFPFLLDPGLVVERPMANVDVWPTLLDMLGLPPLQGTDGVSQLPAVLAAGGIGSAPVDHRVIYKQIDRRWGSPSSKPDPLVGVADGSLRLFMRESRGERGTELYDHATDPGEQNDLSRERPEETARLKELAKSHFQGGHNPWGVEPDEVELDAMKLEQLRALGYVIR